MKKRVLKKQKLKTKKIIFKSFKNVKRIKRSRIMKDNTIKYTKFIMKLILILILISLFIYPYLYEKNKIPLEQYQANVLPEIKSFEANIILNKQTFYEFRKINSQNKLIEENPKFKKKLNPDVSVIITMYNQAHCIYKGLRSVQNQSIKNIEIIIVDDCSEDNSTDVIKEYQKEDPRIILISHDTNEGEIKSRTDGIRKAKGKYITIVDGDDALLHKDVLKHCLFITEKAKIDAIEFRAFSYQKGKLVNVLRIHADKKFSNIIYQPELRTIFVTKKGDNYALINTVIWGKFVKKEVFQNALKYIGTEYTDDYNNEIEDAIMALGIFGLAKSYYTMKEIGYLYSYDEKQGRYPKTKIGKCKFNNKLKQFGEFKVCKFMVDKSNNNYIEKSMVIGFMKMFGLDKKLYNIKFDNRHYKILFYIYDKILEWNCWNNEQKSYIIKQKNFAMKSYEKENILNKTKL